MANTNELPANPTLNDMKNFIKKLSDVEVTTIDSEETLYITSLTTRIIQGE